MSIYRRGRLWWFEFCHEGERIRKRGGRTKKDAIQAEEAAKTDIRRGDLRFAQKIKSPPFNSFADNEYLRRIYNADS